MKAANRPMLSTARLGPVSDQGGQPDQGHEGTGVKREDNHQLRIITVQRQRPEQNYCIAS